MWLWSISAFLYFLVFWEKIEGYITLALLVTTSHCTTPRWQKQPRGLCGHGHIFSLELSSSSTALVLSTGDMCTDGHTDFVTSNGFWLICPVKFSCFLMLINCKKSNSDVQLWNKVPAELFWVGCHRTRHFNSGEMAANDRQGCNKCYITAILPAGPGCQPKHGPCDSSAA